MERILILGGTYFIGKRFVELLTKEDNLEVYTLNRGTRNNECTQVNKLIADRKEVAQMAQMLNALEFDYIVDISCLNGIQAEILMSVINKDKLKK